MTSSPDPEDETTGDAGSPYARLRAEVIAHAIASGSVLTETSVGARYGVSRTPAREALTRLEQDRLVERVPRGYRVRISTAEDVMELYEARISLESTAAASAAMRRTELDLARLQHLSDRLTTATDVAEITAVNAQWHETLWVAAHNSALEDLLQRVIAQMRLFDDGPVGAPPSVEETVREHARILAAVRANDAEEARVALADHLGRTRDIRLAALARTPVSTR